MKTKEVQDKLKTMNLHTEVEGNPLLLSLVTILAQLDDEQKE